MNECCCLLQAKMQIVQYKVSSRQYNIIRTTKIWQAFDLTCSRKVINSSDTGSAWNFVRLKHVSLRYLRSFTWTCNAHEKHTRTPPALPWRLKKSVEASGITVRINTLCSQKRLVFLANVFFFLHFLFFSRTLLIPLLTFPFCYGFPDEQSQDLCVLFTLFLSFWCL